MTPEQLKAIQAPIKEKYRADADSASVTLRSRGVVEMNNLHCWVEASAGRVRAGLHPAAGGNDEDACSAEMLLEALIACAGVTFSAVTTSMGLSINSCEIHAEADMDFRGTLGLDRSVPVGLTAIRLNWDIRSDTSEEVIQKAISLTERYCVIYQTLKSGVATSSSITLRER